MVRASTGVGQDDCGKTNTDLRFTEGCREDWILLDHTIWKQKYTEQNFRHFKKVQNNSYLIWSVLNDETKVLSITNETLQLVTRGLLKKQNYPTK